MLDNAITMATKNVGCKKPSAFFQIRPLGIETKDNFGFTLINIKIG
jgi:hypothetical protein